MDWVRRRDSEGLIVSFPFQNPELVKIAPELAGRPLHLEIHGLDTRTRQVWAGDRLMFQVWGRLPSMKWVIFLNWIPGISYLIKAITSGCGL
jgi:hypothetical protein